MHRLKYRVPFVLVDFLPRTFVRFIFELIIRDKKHLAFFLSVAVYFYLFLSVRVNCESDFDSRDLCKRK